LLKAFLFFGLGFVVRPLGAIIIGNYGDRAGRKAALTLTIMLMAVGTAIIAFFSDLRRHRHRRSSALVGRPRAAGIFRGWRNRRRNGLPIGMRRS